MTPSNRVRLSKLTLGLLAALAAAPAFAQSTSAAVGGEVVGVDGQPVAGAEVTIVHTESGTVSRAVTDEQGRYAARGLRVGGPYTITIVKAGGGTASRDGIYLSLGDVSEVDAQLDASVTTLETVTATAIAPTVFSSDKVGTGTNLSEEQIDSFASIQRNIQDYARLDPRISQTDKERGEISALGQNSRFNSITIDRVSTNDSFGLEANNLPTLKQPISIDAIEAIEINIANYDVIQKGYTGANINAVTKSGTNEFEGSVYGTYREADWVGEDEDGNPFTGFDDETTWGATLGGPIVKDKLFFFANYEKFERTAPAPDFGPAGSGLPNEYEDLTVEDVAEIIDIANNVYGIDPGSATAPASLGTEVEDKMVKLDWNINDYHRASLRYNETEQNEAVLPNIDNNEYSLSSHWYNEVKTFESAVAQVFSDWSLNFSTEFSLSYSKYHSEPDTLSRLPQFRIAFPDTAVYLGREQFRHSNVLDTDTLNAFFAGNWYLGDHEVKFGADYQKNDIYNLFVESSLGAYGFFGLDDFRNGAYSDFALRVAAPGQNPAAEFTLENLGLFVQDTWYVTDNLTLTAGVRYDTPIVDDRPVFNAAASEFFGYRNDATIDGNSLLQPRLGFNYSFDSERPTQLRGGIGLFQGAAANVWLSNPFTNNGLTIDVFGCGFGFDTDCDEIAGLPPVSVDPDNQPRVGDAPAADVDFVDPDLNQPSIWKANLAIDHELPWWGMVATGEVVLTQVKSGIYYEHLNLGAPTGVAPDGRLLYWDSTDPSNYFARFGEFDANDRANANSAYREVLLARETSKGEGQSLTVSLRKPMTEDLFWQVAYTYTNSTDVSPLTSSRSISNWNGRAIYNPNENVSSRSSYVVKDRFTAALSWQHAFFGDNKTTFSVFYEGRNGKPYSWTFDNDANGDGIFGNDLLYVPAGPDDVVWVDGAADQRAFEEFVAANPGLQRARGTVVDRNDEESPWVNTFDVRISQELPGFFGDNKAEIWLDILNFGNLLNDEWGHTEEVGFPFNRGVVEFAGIAEDGRYVYDFSRPDGLRLRDNSGESRWALQVGFRYKF